MIEPRVEQSIDKVRPVDSDPLADVLSIYRMPKADENIKWLNQLTSDANLPQVTFSGLDKPHSPTSKPNHVTADGARIWSDHQGHIGCVKMHNGEIFKFDYDQKGQLKEVTEPDGSRLVRKSGDEWVRTNSKGEEHSFNGQVEAAKDGSVSYRGRDGQTIRFDGNGSTVESQLVDGKELINKVTDANGKSTSFSYDSDGNPFSIEKPDGSWLVKGTDNNWYASRKGHHDEYQPISVQRDNETGRIVIKSLIPTTTYDLSGAHVK